MAFHPDITRKDDVTLAMDTANAAVRIASRQLTSNAGTVEIPNADGTSTIMGVGAGDTGVAPWVGDTIAPGKPLGITAESHNGAVWVSWDGTLDGGVPADFDHVRFTAVDGSKTVDMGQLTAAGKVTAAELTAGDTVTITAIAYDDAHAADGSSAPNASVASDPVTVVVQSAVDASVVKKAQDDAQSALDKAGRAVDTATASKSTADSASSVATQAHATATAANQAATSAQTAANIAIANAVNYVKNPQFHGSNLDSVRNTQMDASDSNAGTLPAAASTYGKNTGGYDCVADAVRIRAIAGHTYRIEIDSKPASDMPSTETEPFGLIYWRMTADNPGITYNQYNTINTTATTVTDWTHSKMEFTYAGTEPWSVFRPAYRARPAQRWLVTNFACTDVTDAKAAQDAAATAQTAADNANTAAQTAKSTADSASSTASTAKSTADSASSMATQAKATAVSANQSATSAQTAANLAIANSQEILADPTFTQKWDKWVNLHAANTNVFFDTNNGNLMLDPNPNVSPWTFLTTTPNLSGTTPVGHDRTYRISCDVRAPLGGTDTIFYVSPANGMNLQIPTSRLSKTDYTHFETDITLKANMVLDANTVVAIWTPGDAGIALRNIHVRDITEAKAAQKAAEDAQATADTANTAAANAASIANTAKAAAQGAQTTADGKNKIFSSASEPAHMGLVPGDLWFQLNSSNHVTGIQTWNGSRFVDYLVVANEILVAGSVGTTQIKNGAITTDLLTSNAVTAIKIAAQTITGDKLNVGSVASAIMTSNLFKTSGTSNYTIVNDSGVTVYKGGKAYTHLGSDTTYGLQAWNPITSNLTDISSMVFGASSIVESNDITTATVGVAPRTQNETPWKNLDVFHENGSWKRFRSPSGRFLVVMTIGYQGDVPRDFVYMYANVNFRKNNGDISVFNDYSATSTPGSSTYNMFTPGTFIGIIVVEPNVDYSVNMSFRTVHYNFGDNGINAYGHCNYRRLFIMPV